MTRKIEQELSGFTPLIDVIIDETGLVPAAVFGIMWRYAQMRDGVCKASMDTLADRLKLNRSTIIRHIAELVDNKYVVDTTPLVRNTPHIYAITDKVKLRSVLAVESKTKDKKGVAESNTYDKRGIAESNTYDVKGVAESNSKSTGGVAFCTGGVAESNMNIQLRDIKKEETKEDTALRAAWELLRGQIQANTQKSFFDTWVKDIKAVDFRDGVLTLAVHNEFAARMIFERMNGTIMRLWPAIWTVYEKERSAEITKIEFCLRGIEHE